MMEVRISKTGEKMNSPHPERRHLYINVEPSEVNQALSLLQNLINMWRYDTINNVPWYWHRECGYCAKRIRYEHEKFTKAQWVWNRKFCMRHYLIDHLYDNSVSFIEVVDSNRPVNFTISQFEIAFETRTRNYHYSIEINREYADMVVVYKGRSYKFRYNNHVNSIPYASSFQMLLKTVISVVEKFKNVLEDIEDMIKNNECSETSHIHINGIVIPACPQDKSKAKTCTFRLPMVRE